MTYLRLNLILEAKNKKKIIFFASKVLVLEMGQELVLELMVPVMLYTKGEITTFLGMQIIHKYTISSYGGNFVLLIYTPPGLVC